LPENIRLGYRGSSGANTLAYLTGNVGGDEGKKVFVEHGNQAQVKINGWGQPSAAHVRPLQQNLRQVEILFFVTNMPGEKARVFDPGRPLQPIPMFACKPRGIS